MSSRVDVYRLYPAMDVFVCSSISEGLGIVAIEAQACGLHVIASPEVPDAADIQRG